MGAASPAYHAKSKPLQAAPKLASKRSMQVFALVAAGVLYFLYTSPSFSLSPDIEASAPFTSISSSTSSLSYASSEPQDPEALLEPKIIPLQLQNPTYNIRVIRSILQHSNTSWQDTPGEARGYFVQSLLWMQVVRHLAGHSAQGWLKQSADRYVPAK